MDRSDTTDIVQLLSNLSNLYVLLFNWLIYLYNLDLNKSNPSRDKYN